MAAFSHPGRYCWLARRQEAVASDTEHDGEACPPTCLGNANDMRFSCQVLFTDTVGFIQKLPTQLVAAFRATLEEIADAALLLHVVDVSHPNAAAQSAAVEAVLQELGAADMPTLTVWNKVQPCFLQCSTGKPHGVWSVLGTCRLDSLRCVVCTLHVTGATNAQFYLHHRN